MGVGVGIMEEAKEKFKIQVEMFSEKYIRSAAKKLDKEELDMFIDVLEGRNAELREELTSLKKEIARRADNHGFLIEAVGEGIPRKALSCLKDYLNGVEWMAMDTACGDK
ncbi:hypothetical protein HK407_04g08250 [Ordospora pajunii]|jgi:hypothetical protein|uniref:uncharacterized protein n=1 Tax=Ordospora pajunii TaxID=3039483 RepID=UPI00295284F6|nr:uncharacterized protein HK407_04g08250 [Ordospora pajunii]KAH9411714.1 hypothetical protein HK407_04g08250 [Ordospora pajunii]